LRLNKENQILIKDTPILKSTEDLLFRDIFIDSIATSIRNYKDNESLTIGLYGKWGEGKTSIINLLIENLDKDEDIIYLRFEPWLYSNTEQLISMFFKDLSKSIGKKEKLRQLAKFFSDYAEIFETLSNFPEPTGMAKFGFKTLGFAARKLPSKKTLSELKVDIESYLKTLDKKIYNKFYRS
jgi:predicted KAP-like P-loop ATPase